MRAVEGKGGQHLLERSNQVGHDGLAHRERKFQPVTVVLGVRDVAGDENVAGTVADEGEIDLAAQRVEVRGVLERRAGRFDLVEHRLKFLRPQFCGELAAKSTDRDLDFAGDRAVVTVVEEPRSRSRDRPDEHVLCARIADQDVCARCHYASRDGRLQAAGRPNASNAAHYARAADIISPVYIESSAPTRIDLAGGTLDIWPLYLFHEHAQTINAAISLRARCSIQSRASRGLSIVSGDTGRRVDVAHWSELRDNHELRLLGRLLHYFQADGIEVQTRSESPVGAGIAGSSALNIAVCGALIALSGRERSDAEIMQIAMNVEAQAIDVPTGVQDYRPALYGGISAVELAVDGVRRVPLPVSPADLQNHLVLAYTGASRNSGINNWEVTKRHIDGDRNVQQRFARIRDIAVAMRDALERQAWDEVGRQIAEEWENRKGLAPGVTTPEIDAILGAAKNAGATGGKVCGAGGGGCLVCLGEPADVPAIRQAIAAHGGQLLDFTIEAEGLRVESRTTA
jgi:D-glycero-alpha-D-manno-heptose-7-phosphate kinase